MILNDFLAGIKKSFELILYYINIICRIEFNAQILVNFKVICQIELIKYLTREQIYTKNDSRLFCIKLLVIY